MKMLHRFARDTSAATAVEYALIIAGIAVLGLASLPALAAAINVVLGKIGIAVG